MSETHPESQVFKQGRKELFRGGEEVGEFEEKLEATLKQFPENHDAIAKKLIKKEKELWLFAHMKSFHNIRFDTVEPLLWAGANPDFVAQNIQSFRIKDHEKIADALMRSKEYNLLLNNIGSFSVGEAGTILKKIIKKSPGHIPSIVDRLPVYFAPEAPLLSKQEAEDVGNALMKAIRSTGEKGAFDDVNARHDEENTYHDVIDEEGTEETILEIRVRSAIENCYPNIRLKK